MYIKYIGSLSRCLAHVRDPQILAIVIYYGLDSCIQGRKNRLLGEVEMDFREVRMPVFSCCGVTVPGWRTPVIIAKYDPPCQFTLPLKFQEPPFLTPSILLKMI